MDLVHEFAIRATGVSKVYQSGAEKLKVLEDLSFGVARGERVALTGESGSGKTTLLFLLGGLDRPTAGRIEVDSVDITLLEGNARAFFRNRTLGFVWQQPSLLPEFTAMENVSMPLRIQGTDGAEADRMAEEALDEVGLRARAGHRAGELSGGEQQRVSLARAMVARPSVLLADEPTGNLDHRTGGRIIDLLEELHRRRGLTSVIVTHNPDFAARCDRTLVLENGHLHGHKIGSRSYV